MRSCVVIVMAVIGILLLLLVVPSVVRLRTYVPVQFTDSMAKYRIIVCGDSRADRGLDPDVIAAATGLPTINIATPGQDLYSFSKCFKAADISHKILVVSASFFQLNDGAIDRWSFPVDSYEDLPLKQRISMYGSRPFNFLYMQEKIFEKCLFNKGAVSEFGTLSRPGGDRFLKKACMPFSIDDNWFRSHPWYKDVKLDGNKRDLLRRGLDNLASLKDCKVLIYNAPVSASFYEGARRLGVLRFDRSYDSLMAAECRIRNLSFHSFLEDTTLRNNQLFYDASHLCVNGTALFSPVISDLLFSEGIVKK